MDTIATITNEGPTPDAALGSVSHGDGEESEAALEPARVLMALAGSAGEVGSPGISASNLIVRGTKPFTRALATRSPLESILSQVDRRARILDTESAPWRMICSLHIRGRFRGFVGTGWFAGPRTIITAGHCVYGPELGGWATDITIFPARNGERQPLDQLVSKRFSTTDRWRTERNPDFDYAAIHLGPEAEAITRKTGWFSTAALNDAALDAQRVNVSGYPVDKGFAELTGSEQWFHAKQIVHATPRRIYYDVDTMGGQSGAPVWLESEEGPRVVGIHAYGAGGAVSVGLEANSAPRITEEVLAVLKGWIEKR
jgi:V8-like Glu-specific endopeptidase